MPKFTVIVTRDCTESVLVEIDASDGEEAEGKAMNEVRANPAAWQFVHDDCSGDQSEIYTTGADPVDGEG